MKNNLQVALLTDAQMDQTPQLSIEAIAINDSTSVASTSSPSRPNYGSTAAKFILGGMGAGAGFLYWNASGTCVDSMTCGQSIANVLSSTEMARWTLFLSGAIGFSGSNVYYSSQFYDNFADYMRAQKNLSAKMLKGSFVLAYGTLQTAQILLAALGTGGSLSSYTTILTVGGALPGNLFGAVRIARNTIPHTYAAFSQSMTDCYYRFKSPKTQEEVQERDRQLFYRQQQSEFLKRAQANFKQLVSKARSLESNALDIKESQKLLTLLFEQAAALPDEANCSQWDRYLAKTLGAGLAVNFTYPIVKNTFDLMQQYGVPSTALQLTTTTLLTSSMIYANLRFTVEGVDNFYKNLKNVLKGQAIDSLAFQLNPKTIGLATALCVATSILSYAVINVMWDQSYDEAEKDTLRHGARAGIDIYHAYTLILLCIEILSNVTKNAKAKALFAIEKKVDLLQKQPLKDFITYAEELDHNQKTLFGIKTFNQAAANSSAIENAEQKSSMPVQQPKRQRSWCSWFSFGCTNQPGADDDDIEESNMVKAMK